MKSFLPRSHRLVFILFILLDLSVGAFAQSGRVQPTPAPTPDETVRIVTEEIKLNVLAFDDEGNFFGDVTAQDLVITEDNILHQPTSVRRLPANILIVMDTGGEMRSVKSLDWTRKVARSLVNSLKVNDSVAIMQYSDKATIVDEWTTNKMQTLGAISAKTGFGRKSAFVDAIKMATDFLLRDPIENRHLVLITDGTDSQGQLSAKVDAFRRLTGTDISVHVLSYTSMEGADIAPRTSVISNSPPPKALPDSVRDQLPKGGVQEAASRPRVGPTINLDRTLIKRIKSRKADLETSEQQLERLAEDTNGEFILPSSTDEMVEKAPLVAKMIDASYVVTYTPKLSVVENRGVAERTIDVTSKRPGLIVQARRKLVINSKK